MSENTFMVIMILSLTLTFGGLFSKYKIFLLLAIAPIFAMAYEFTSGEYEGSGIIATAMAGWILFNIYISIFGATND